MTDQSTVITQKFDQSPGHVFAAITDVRGWWSRNIQGGTSRVGDEFDYEVPDVHRCRIRVTKAAPGQRVTWLVVKNTFSFVQDQQEWIDTEIQFEINTDSDGKSVLRFTHVGLVPEFECFDVCERSWAFYVGHSLRRLIMTGEGVPNEVADDVEVIGARMDAATG